MLVSLSASGPDCLLDTVPQAPGLNALCERVMSVLREPSAQGKNARLQTASFALLRQVAQAEGPGRFRLAALDGDAVVAVTCIEELTPVTGRPGHFRGSLRVNPRRGSPQSWLFALAHERIIVTAEPGNY